jgi:hypothetical protein
MAEDEDGEEVKFYEKVGGGDLAVEDISIRFMIYLHMVSVIKIFEYKERRMFLYYHGIRCIYCGRVSKATRRSRDCDGCKEV